MSTDNKLMETSAVAGYEFRKVGSTVWTPLHEGEVDTAKAAGFEVRELAAPQSGIGQPVAYLRAADLERLAPPHVAGCGASLSKEEERGFVAIYSLPQVVALQARVRDLERLVNGELKVGGSAWWNKVYELQALAQ